MESKTNKTLIALALILMAFLFVNSFRDSSRDVLLPYEEYYMNEDGDVIISTIYPEGYSSRAGLDSNNFYVNPSVGDEVEFYSNTFSKPKQGILFWLSDATGLFSFKSGTQFDSSEAVSSGRFKLETDVGPKELIDGKSFGGNDVLIGLFCDVGDYINVYEVEKNFWGVWLRQNNLFGDLYKKEYSSDGIRTEQTHLGMDEWSGYYHYECLKPLFFEQFAYKCNQVSTSAAIINFEKPYWFAGTIQAVSCPSGQCAPNPISQFFPKVYYSSVQPVNDVLINYLCVEDQSHCGKETVGSWKLMPASSKANAKWEERYTIGFSPLPNCAEYEKVELKTTCLSGYQISEGVTESNGLEYCKPIVTECPKDSVSSWRNSNEKLIDDGLVQERTLVTYSSYPKCAKSVELEYRTVCDTGFVKASSASITECVPNKDCSKKTYTQETNLEVDALNTAIYELKHYGVSASCSYTLIETEYKTICSNSYHIAGEAPGVTQKTSANQLSCIAPGTEVKTIYTLSNDEVRCYEDVVPAAYNLNSNQFLTRAACEENIEPVIIEGFRVVVSANGEGVCEEFSYSSSQSEPDAFYDFLSSCERNICTHAPDSPGCETKPNYDAGLILMIILGVLVLYFVYDEYSKGSFSKKTPRKKSRFKRRF